MTLSRKGRCWATKPRSFGWRPASIQRWPIRAELNSEIERLLAALDTGNAEAIAESLARVDALRDDLNRKLDSIRADMLAIVAADAATTVHKQRQAMLIAVDRARCRLGARVCGTGQQWYGASGPPAARGGARGRGAVSTKLWTSPRRTKSAT